MIKYIILTVLVFSCKCTKAQIGKHLESDSLLNEVFTTKQIKELEKIITYVDSVVISKTDVNYVEKAYHIYLDSLQNRPEGYRAFDAIEEEKKYSFLESLDKSVFDAIWRIETTVGLLQYKDTIVRNLKNFKAICPNSNGQYMAYLKKTEIRNPYYGELYDRLDAIGNLSAGDYLWFTTNHSNFDFDRVENRLYAAIFIMGVEETYDKKYERYIKNQKQ